MPIRIKTGTNRPLKMIGGIKGMCFWGLFVHPWSGHRPFSFPLYEVLCPPSIIPKKPCNVPFFNGFGTICWILSMYGHTLFIYKVAMEKKTLPKYYMNERSRATNKTGKQHMMERLGNVNSILVVVTNYVPLTFSRCLNDR